MSLSNALTFAMLRAKNKSLRPPDAIQLACASSGDADYFFTNDDRLNGMDSDGKLEKCAFDAWQFLQSM